MYDGTPFPGATVTLHTGDGDRTFVTRTNGMFAFSDVPAGRQQITVELAGFRKSVKQVDVKPGIARGGTVVLESATIDDFYSIRSDASRVNVLFDAASVSVTRTR